MKKEKAKGIIRRLQKKGIITEKDSNKTIKVIEGKLEKKLLKEKKIIDDKFFNHTVNRNVLLSYTELKQLIFTH